jgi:exodeoxyribonuclease V alpha subunit
MQVVNDWDRGVANGEIGYVRRIDPLNRKEACTVDFGDRMVNYTRSDLAGLRLGYVITDHKSQGSEYPCIIQVVDKSHNFMLDRSLLYTGITRATEFVGMVGQMEAFKRAVEKDPVDRRTTLEERMRAK